ncbi:MAG: hypothetical protein HY924_14700 [Elusimicrobia bacterium]|nr:hypothetical protein [Elusimicrobiota bacterium]
MQLTAVLTLALAGLSPGWAQVRVLPRAVVPVQPMAGPAVLQTPGSLNGVPGIGSILPAPRVEAPALPGVTLGPGLLTAGSPAFQELAASPGPSPVEAAPDPGPGDGLSSAMAVQGAVLGMLSRATGFDPLVFSLGMAMAGGGLTVKDWNDLGKGLQAIETDWEEIESVLTREVKSPNFSEEFRQGKKIRPDDLFLLDAVIKELPREVEIKRNNHYLGWLYKWEDGEASASGASFRNHSVRRVKEGWMISLGEVPGPAGAEKLRVTLADLPGMPADAKPQVDKLLASPLLTQEQRQDLLALSAELEAAGLLPAGYTAARR